MIFAELPYGAKTECDCGWSFCHRQSNGTDIPCTVASANSDIQSGEKSTRNGGKKIQFLKIMFLIKFKIIFNKMIFFCRISITPWMETLLPISVTPPPPNRNAFHCRQLRIWRPRRWWTHPECGTGGDGWHGTQILFIVCTITKTWRARGYLNKFA